MHAHAPLQPHVDARGSRVVEVAPAPRDQAHRQTPHLRFTRPPGRHPFDPGAAVDEEPVLSVDEEVGDERVVEEGAEECQRGIVIDPVVGATRIRRRATGGAVDAREGRDATTTTVGIGRARRGARMGFRGQQAGSPRWGGKV